MPRAAAARLLTAYFSTLTSHPVGLRGFAAAALEAYAAGIPAAALTAELLPAEFDVEGSRRRMFGSSADATKFFALFVTTAYVAAEEEGLLPEAEVEQWAEAWQGAGRGLGPPPGMDKDLLAWPGIIH